MRRKLNSLFFHLSNFKSARPSIPPKTQNGLRNQLNPHPYKPPTAQCESAQPLSKTNHTPKRNSQTTKANCPNALSRQQPKTPETPPIPTPKTPKKHPCQHTPRYLYHLSHQPNYQRKPYRKNTDTDTRVSDSELNRHGLLPLPGGNCISIPSER